MMNLKQHNDIVEKLIKQLDLKQNQINSLKKELKKVPSQMPQREPTAEETRLTKKISQLNKEHKERVNQLNQELRGKSRQNKELKEKLTLKKNMQAKQKQYAAQIVKKKFDQKAMTNYDHKVNSLISHYQCQLQKKNKQVENLQKQIKTQFYQNQSKNSENIPEVPKQNHHFKYQTEINKIKNQTTQYKKLYQEKSKQFQDLAKRYNQLTKQYYQIINEEPVKKKTTKSLMHGLLQETINNEEQMKNSEESQLSYSFMTNMNDQPQKNEVNLDRKQLLIENICEIVDVRSESEIIAKVSQMKAKVEEVTVYEAISKFMHSLLYRLGMGKIPMNQLYQQLEKLQERINRFQEASDLLDQLCIEVGAKKNKILDKIMDLKATEEQFFTNMKDVKFMQQLPKANKIAQFIEYFQLERSALQLPDQLKIMYDQLKHVDKFMRQANTLLNRENSGLERSLEGIMRYLERKKAEEEIGKKK